MRILKDHNENCILVNGTQAAKMPEKGDNILKFINHHKQQPVPFVIYADFESILEKLPTKKQNDNESYTEAFQKHVACGVAYKLVCCYDDKYSKPILIYRGENAAFSFLEGMLQEVE